MVDWVTGGLDEPGPPPMRISLGNAWAQIESADPAQRRWLEEYTGCERRGPFGDAEWAFMVTPTGLLPAGLVVLAERAAPSAGVALQVVDQRGSPPCSIDAAADLAWLRPDQLGAVEAMAAAGRGLLQAPTGCLAGDSMVGVNRAGKGFQIMLDALVRMHHGGVTNYHRWNLRIPTMVRSRASDGTVRLSRLLDAVESGVQRVFEVRLASGQSLKATSDHRFLTASGWKRAWQLVPGDLVCVEQGRKPLGKQCRVSKSWYKLRVAKGHPYAGRRGVYPRKGGWTVPLHRLVVEAQLNGLPLEEFLRRCNVGEVQGLWFLDPAKWAVHHMDGDVLNNEASNLAVMLHREHFAVHATSDLDRLLVQTTFSPVASVLPVGEAMTYDLILDEPHNFLANGMVVHNSGKTEVFIALTRVFPCEWLLVVHRLDLVEQTAARYLKRTGETAGTFLRGRWEKGTGNVTVATFQSVKAASRKRRKAYLDFRDAVQAVFVDEVHAQPAQSFYQVTMSLKNAYYRFGCSATPLMRGDLAALRTVGALGPVVHQTTVREMVDLDLLARPRVRMVRMRHKHDECWSWHEVYKRCLVRSAERNGLVADMVERAAKPALVFVDHLEHARALKPELEARGLLVALADGHDWKDARARVLGRLGRGELDAVVCTVIFQEGIDVPELRSVVVGAGKASAVAAVQRVGRGMRKVAGKDEFEVWDVWDRSQKWLRQHSKDRAAAYASLGYEVEVLEEVPGILENEEISPKLASDDEDEDGASGERSESKARHWE